MDELKDIKGIPNYITLDSDIDYNYMTFDIEGENLTKVFKKCHNTFPLNVSQSFHRTLSTIGGPGNRRSAIVYHRASS